MLVSIVLALALVEPSKIVRSDGTVVSVAKHQPLRTELANIFHSVKREPWIVFFLPFSFGALFYPAYQTNDFNGYFFNVRTRAVNGLLYGIAQMLGSMLLGLMLDLPFMKRKTRAILGWASLTTVIFTVSLCGYFAMRHSNRAVPYNPPLDITSGSLAHKYMTLYFFFGWQDGMSQAFAFWIIGCLSNDPNVLSMYSAFFKVFGSIACAIAFATDADKISFIRMYGPYWAVTLFGILFMSPLIFLRIQNVTDEIEDGSNQADREV
jgi:hypothetical protein